LPSGKSATQEILHMTRPATAFVICFESIAAAAYRIVLCSCCRILYLVITVVSKGPNHNHIAASIIAVLSQSHIMSCHRINVRRIVSYRHCTVVSCLAVSTVAVILYRDRRIILPLSCLIVLRHPPPSSKTTRGMDTQSPGFLYLLVREGG